MLPCFFKHLTGFDCPGCGFQRSVLALFRGDFVASLQLYPAAVLILILSLISVLEVFYPVKELKILRKVFLVASAGVVIVSYAIKIIDHTSSLTAA